MNSFKDITTNIAFDIAVEALAGLVIDNNTDVSVEQLRIRPVAHLHKGSGREVLNISQGGFDNKGNELIYFDISRPGLFDSLPEMLFHSRGIFEDDVEQAGFIAKERDDARHFFLPFEEELYKSRICVELKEREVLRELNLEMLKVYNLDIEKVPIEKQGPISAFAFFLPSLSRIVGNLELTCSVLQMVLNKTINVTTDRAPSSKLPASFQSCLGDADLGHGFILGDVFSDGGRQLEFSISGVEPAELEDWIPGGEKRKLLEENFFPFLLAAGECYNIVIMLNKQQEMVLGDELSSNILGYAII